MTRKPASLGAMLMLGGGLLIYWALSQWNLFGLGEPPEIRATFPEDKSTPGFGGGGQTGGSGESAGF